MKAIAEDDIQIYDIEKYNESVPDEAKEYIDENSEFTFSKLLDIIKKLFFGNLPDALKKIASLAAVCLCGAACSSFCSGLNGSETVNSAANILISACTVGVIADVIENAILKGAELSEYSSALSLAMSSFLVFGGNPVSATVLSSGLALFTAGMSLIIKSIIPGLCAVMLALTFATGASGISSSPVKKISNFYIITLTSVMSLISILLAFQFSTSKNVETITIKGIKLASSYAIPIVGGMLADAAQTVAGSFSLLKNTFGISALIIIITLLLPQVLSILMYKLGFCIIKIMSDFLGGGSSSVIDCADSLLNVLLTTVVFSSCSFIFCIYLFLGAPVAA